MSGASARCPHCGAAVDRDLQGGVCDACLLEDALLPAEGYASPPSEHPLATDTPVIQHFGPYQLLEEIGRGGMGVIYKAHHPGLDRIVALKMLLAGEFADARSRDRLLREARIAARLAHPHIVTIHDVGEHQGRPYFAMEFVPGPNLAQLTRDGLIPLTTAVRYLEQLARAVHFAHQHGVIHRDLKPANVLISPDDQPKLTDFGLTKSLVEPTGSIESAGSPNYMAPEQADSSLGATGTPTDVFGLGAILYFLLTGRPPATGETLSETLRSVVAADPVPPAQLRPALPADLNTIVLRCLEKDPSARYASALEVAEELARWQRHEPILARPPAPFERLTKWVRRRPAIAALSVACVLVLLGGLATTTWQWRQAVARQSEAEQENYVSSLAAAVNHVRDGRFAPARDLLLRQPEHLRGWEWGRLLAECHDVLVDEPMLNLPPDRMVRLGADLCVSDDGELLAAWENGELEVLRIRSGEKPFRMGSDTQQVRLARFSPDHRLLAVLGSTPGYQLIDTDTWNVVATLDAEELQPRWVAFSPEGRRLATWGEDRQGAVWRLPEGVLERRLQRLDTVLEKSGALEFSPDGERLFFRGPAIGSRLPIWDATSGELLAEVPSSVEGLRSVTLTSEARHFAVITAEEVGQLWEVGASTPVFSTDPLPQAPDGRRASVAFACPSEHRLATLQENGRLSFWDTRTGRFVGGSSGTVIRSSNRPDHLLVTHSGEAQLEVWDWRSGRVTRTLSLGTLNFGPTLWSTPDSRFIAAVVAHGYRDVRALLWPHRGPVSRLSSEIPFMRAAPSPDGTRIAGAHFDGRGSIWDASTGRRRVVLNGHLRWVMDVCWSGDGQSVFSGSADHTLRRWNPDTGELVATYTGLKGPVLGVGANHDGSRVAGLDLAGLAGLWDTGTGTLLNTWPTRTNLGGWSITFSPDDRWLALGESRGFGRVFEARTGREAFIPDAPNTDPSEGFAMAAFSHDSRRLASTSRGGRLRVWETGTWRKLVDVRGTGLAPVLAFSPDNSRLLLGLCQEINGLSGPTMIAVHDATTGHHLVNLSSVPGWTSSLHLAGSNGAVLRNVVDFDLVPRGVEVLEVFPWQADAYAGQPGETLSEQILTWSRARSWERLDRPRSVHVDAPLVPWVPPRTAWPARASDAPSGCLDLTSHYNAHLHLCAFAHTYWPVELFTLASLPQGIVKFDGVLWDIRGLITAGREEAEPYATWPAGSRVSGIPVQRRGRTLHFLHALWKEGPANDPPGVYELHYTDGSTARLPLRRGVDIGFWTSDPEKLPPREARVAWEGSFSAAVRVVPGNPRLYHRAYPNPHPEREIASFDLVAGGTTVPFVVAVTVE